MLKINHNFKVLLAGRLLQIIITLCTLRISTTLLPQAELGYVYYIIAVQSFFSLFLINPAGQYLNRQTAKWSFEGMIYGAYKKQLLYILLITILSFLLMSIFTLFDMNFLPYNLLIITSFLILSQSANQTIVPMLNMLELRVAFVFFNLLTALLCLICSYAFITFFSPTALSWVAGLIVGNSVVAMLATFRFRSKYLLTKTKKLSLDFKEIRKFCFPIAIATIFMWFLNSGYRMVVESLYGLEFLAFLGVGFAVSSQVFSIAESLLTQYLIPELFKNSEKSTKEKRTELVNVYFYTVIPLYVSLALFLTFSVKYLFPFVIGEQYYDAYRFAIYGSWIELGRVLVNTFAVVSQVEKKTVKFILPYALGAIYLSMGLFLNNWLQFEVQIQTLLVGSSIVVLVSMYTSMRSYLLFSIPFKKILLSVFITLPAISYFIIFNFSAEFSLSNFMMCFFGGGLYLTGLFIMNKKNN